MRSLFDEVISPLIDPSKAHGLTGRFYSVTHLTERCGGNSNRNALRAKDVKHFDDKFKDLRRRIMNIYRSDFDNMPRMAPAEYPREAVDGHDLTHRVVTPEIAHQ